MNFLYYILFACPVFLHLIKEQHLILGKFWRGLTKKGQ